MNTQFSEILPIKKPCNFRNSLTLQGMGRMSNVKRPALCGEA